MAEAIDAHVRALAEHAVYEGLNAIEIARWGGLR